MYGAPVWHEVLVKSQLALFVEVQKMIAVRVACAYRTAALEAVRVFARISPADLLAGQQAEIFKRVCEVRTAEIPLDST